MLNRFRTFLKAKQEGAAMVEYALIVSGVALIAAASVSVFGHKTNDLIAMTAAVLPGAHSDDNGPIASGHIIETLPGSTTSSIALDINTIKANSGTDRLDGNLGTGDVSVLVLEPQ